MGGAHGILGVLGGGLWKGILGALWRGTEGNWEHWWVWGGGGTSLFPPPPQLRTTDPKLPPARTPLAAP